MSSMTETTAPVGCCCNKRKYTIHNALERPDLWDVMEDPDHPLNTAWPEFLDHDVTHQTYYPKLTEYEGLARYQFVITETLSDDQTSVVACAASIPFFWPEIHQSKNGKSRLSRAVLETLPDGGYDTILSRGMRQYFTRSKLPGAAVAFTKDQEHDTPLCHRADPPNALSAICITVQPNRRRQGLAEALIKAIISTARAERLELLVVPLRPTRKADFPLVSMPEYIKWSRVSKPSLCVEHTHIASTREPKPQDESPENDSVCFDPWLRKHILLGGQVIKVAPRSMIVHASLDDWRKWTSKNFFQGCNSKSGASPEACFPGGLAPLAVDATTETGVYVEPNVWLFHDLENDRGTA